MLCLNDLQHVFGENFVIHEDIQKNKCFPFIVRSNITFGQNFAGIEAHRGSTPNYKGI